MFYEFMNSYITRTVPDWSYFVLLYSCASDHFISSESSYRSIRWKSFVYYYLVLCSIINTILILVSKDAFFYIVPSILFAHLSQPILLSTTLRSISSCTLKIYSYIYFPSADQLTATLRQLVPSSCYDSLVFPHIFLSSFIIYISFSWPMYSTHRLYLDIYQMQPLWWRGAGELHLNDTSLGTITCISFIYGLYHCNSIFISRKHLLFWSK